MSDTITPAMALFDQMKLNGLPINEEGSLNAGAELDDELEPKFYNPLEYVDTSDIQENIATITALESCVTDLLYLVEDIHRAGGMKQSFALEAEKLLPGFISKAPIGYYTVETSATRHKVSLEEISAGIWALITAAVSAVIAAIVKFTKWLLNREDEDGKTNIEQVEEDITKREACNDVWKEANDLVKKDNLIKQTNIDDLLAEYIKDHGDNRSLSMLIEARDPVFHDIINNGEYTKVIKLFINKVVPIYDNILKPLVTYMDILATTAIEETRKSYPTDKFVFNEVGNSTIEVQGKGDMLLLEASKYIITVRDSVIANKVSDKISFSKLNDLFKNKFGDLKTNDDIISNYSDSISSLQKTLDKDLVILEDLARTGNSIDLAIKPYVTALKKTISVVSSDVMATNGIVAQIAHYFIYVRKLSQLLNKVQLEAFSIVESEIKDHNGSVPEEFKELHQKLKDILNK